MASQPLVSGLVSYHKSSISVLATPSPLQESQETEWQSKVKASIEDELKGAMTTSNAILHADSRTVEAVINSSGATFQPLISGGTGKSSVTNPQFPQHCFAITDGSMPSPGELLETILHGIIGKQCSSLPHFLLTILV